MKAVEIKIFGQSFQISPPDGTADYYLEIASRLDKMMVEESVKSDLRSDIKVAVKVAFMLMVENAELKADHDKLLELVARLDERIDSFIV